MKSFVALGMPHIIVAKSNSIMLIPCKPFFPTILDTDEISCRNRFLKQLFRTLSCEKEKEEEKEEEEGK